MSDRTQQLLDALAPLALAAKQQAELDRSIAALRNDGIERSSYLGRATRWQALYDAAAAAMEASMSESDGYAMPSPPHGAALQMETR
jgi:hypothetical protein